MKAKLDEEVCVYFLKNYLNFQIEINDMKLEQMNRGKTKPARNTIPNSSKKIAR